MEPFIIITLMQSYDQMTLSGLVVARLPKSTRRGWRNSDRGSDGVAGVVAVGAPLSQGPQCEMIVCSLHQWPHLDLCDSRSPQKFDSKVATEGHLMTRC